MAELPELYSRRLRDSEALLKHTATEAAHTVSRPKRRRLERTPRKYFTLYGRNVTLGNLPEDYVSTQRRKEVAHRRNPTRSVCSTTYHLLPAVGRSTYMICGPIGRLRPTELSTSKNILEWPRRRDMRRVAEDEDRTECNGRSWVIMWAET